MAAQGVFTNLYRTKYGHLADDAVVDPTLMLLKFFRVGEAGFVEVPPLSGNRFPKAPNATFADIEADGITGFRYQKDIGAANVTHDGSGTVTVVCKLDLNEVGLDGNGILVPTDPHLFEVGIFDDNGDMMAYATYDEEVKIPGKAIDISIVITF